jgi:hypothetical protein
MRVVIARRRQNFLSHPLLDVKAGGGDLLLAADEVAGKVAEAFVEFQFCFSAIPIDFSTRSLAWLSDIRIQSPVAEVRLSLAAAGSRPIGGVGVDSTRCRASSIYAGFRSMPVNWRPSFEAATATVPEPTNGSSTRPPGGHEVTKQRRANSSENVEL